MTPDPAFTHPNAPSPQAAVALIEINNPAQEILLIQRPVHPQDPWGGHLALPGGKIEDIDRSPLEAAIRETKEEVCVDLSICTHPDTMPTALAGRIVGRSMVVAPFVFVLEERPPIVPEPSEVARHLWVPRAQLEDQSAHAYGPVVDQYPDKSFPHMIIEETVLWGFTYKVLCEYVGITPRDS